MFNKKPFNNLDAALLQAKQQHLDHQDQAEYHRHMTEYFAGQIRMIERELNGNSSYQEPTGDTVSVWKRPA